MITTIRNKAAWFICLIFLVLIIIPGLAEAWNIGGTSYGYRYPVLSNATTENWPIAINDTFGINGDIFRAPNNTGIMYVYSTSSGPAGAMTIGDATNELNWSNSSNGAGFNPTSAYPSNWSAAYPFDEGSGTMAYDRTGRNNGSHQGNPVYNSSGLFNYAITLDGNGDWIDGGKNTSLDLTTIGTISAWMQKYDNDDWTIIVGKHSSSGTADIAYLMQVADTGVLRCFLSDGGSTAAIAGSTNLEDGLIHHTVCRWNGSMLSAWVDGVPEGEVAQVNAQVNAGVGLRIGYYWNTIYLYGSIDEVFVINDSLSDTQIQELYQEGINNLTALGSEETDTNTPAITIEDPDNITYYSTQVPLNFTAVDNDLATFPCWYLIDGTPTSIGNLTNNTYYDTTLTLNGAHYNLTVHCEDPGAAANGTASEFFHIFSGFNVSVYDNDTNATMTDWTICFENSSDQNCSSDQNNSAFFEWNTVPQASVNITVSDGSAALYYFNSTYAGTNNESNYENLSAYLEPKDASTLALTSSPGWTIDVNTEITITCTASESTPDLYRDGINVSNPYTATLDFALFNFTCTIGETTNYAPTSTTSWLNVLSGGFGCTDNATYAFVKTITTPGNNMTLNFSVLVNNNYVKSDLSDVRVMTTNASTTKNGSYLIVDTENVSNITVRFANYFANISHSDGALITESMDNMTSYSENDPYYVLTFIEETTGTEQLPPNSTRTLVLYCSQGTTWRAFNSSQILVATNEQLDSIKTLIEYTATEIYYRSLIAKSTVEHKNFYLVDADDHQVAQLLITLQDATGEFSTATLIIRKYLEGTLETITELDFDAEDKAIIYLINGDRYQIYVDNGDETRSIGYLYVDTVDLSKTITIGEILTTNQTHGNISFGLYNTSDTIVFSYIDAAGQAISGEMWVYNASNTSQLLYYTNTTNRSRFEFTYQVPSTNQTYNVHVKVGHAIFGENSIDLWIPMFSGILIIPHPLEPLSGLFGTIPGGISWQNLVGVFAVIGAAMLFTAHSGAMGGVFAVAVGAVLFVFGWWTVNVAILAVAFVLGILNKLTERKREA